MIRRVLVIASALVLAIVGGVVTFSYASGADARAMAGLEPTPVLVVVEPIAQGTPASAIADAVELDELPASAVAPGALTDLGDIADQVATSDLVVGEQLLASRFAAPDDLGGAVEVPEGMHLLTFDLEARRVVGGDVQAGDRVGVFVSDGDPLNPATRLVQHRVLVVAIAGGASTTTNAETGEQTEQAAQPMISITLAVDATAAQQLVYSAEYELLYLSLEPEGAADGPGVITEVIR
ncbi:Flp pilus assembly protein CpaB [Agrococcus jejuensis]|uniref:Pilus assembly protein CpaB n=1 Tax=Agrococcus jejuensis TaxID=399736 RepID=A0A1G8E9Z1_9MICO|nr:RcpC/CpaB family pilus assembly protein [Agrococcus jejuensis]SDH66570.1 pilus assembly protein CpaB [Agrococcus jejuensis]